jgi:tetratricopeptide (TPR) repeat protein
MKQENQSKSLKGERGKAYKDASQVKVWEEEITIPTYRLGPEDKNPPILMERKNPIHAGSSIIYPYPMREWLTNTKENKVWKALFLENPYLRLIILPELGGHLLSVFDKISEEEALYRNHVLKYARIGIRGAWVSGGIEWNFPNGHTVTTTSPIDYSIRKNPDGSKTVFVGDLEKVSRMRWSVGITLYEDDAFFETEMRLFNRTSLPHRFWFWANSAAPASPGLEFITTATKVMNLTDVMDFPVHEGVDLSWDRNHMTAQDLFSLNPKQDFVAWYNHDLDRGMINYADRSEAQGCKFFTWGNSDDGKIWTELLTENDGPYSEMQSGRLRTMRIWEILPPHSVESWKEVWYPVRKIGTPVFANEKAAFSLSRLKGKNSVRVGVFVTAPQPNAEIALLSGDEIVWKRKKDLDPAHPLSTDISIQGKKYNGKKARLRLSGAEGQVLAQFSPQDYETEPEVRGYIKIEPTPKKTKAEEQWKCGLEHEKIGELQLAEVCYQNALKDDPGYSPAHRSLGILNLRRGLYERALSELDLALQRNRSEEGARFFHGVVYMSMERFDMAEEELKTLSRSRRYGAAGSYLLGGLYLGMGKIGRAIDQLQKSIQQYPENLDAEAMLACARRKQGRVDRAGTHIGHILNADPLNFLALAEDYFAAQTGENKKNAVKKKGDLKNILRDEVQSYLELSSDYARFGLYDEGIQILTIYCSDHTRSRKIHPLLHYYLGYYYEKIGEDEKALHHYKLGGEMKPSAVFPHRAESEMILKKVQQLIPRQGKPLYYLGNLLCARDRVSEAIQVWEKAAKKEKNLSELHRNLGRVYWRFSEEPDRAIEEYEIAIECDPNDYKLYYELDKLYAKLGLTERRLTLIARIPEKLLENDMIAERVANFYTDIEEYDRALDILTKTHFFPWEFYTEGRRLYECTNIGRGIEQMLKRKYHDAIKSFKNLMKYPKNIGVGEPARKNYSEAFYRIGLVYEKAGETEKALEFWGKAASEEHAEWGCSRYYQARALQCLGRDKEADLIFDGLLSYAEGNLARKRGNEEDSLYLLGLAHKGRGKQLEARQFFRKALALNSSLRYCRWELKGLAGE